MTTNEDDDRSIAKSKHDNRIGNSHTIRTQKRVSTPVFRLSEGKKSGSLLEETA